MEVEAIHLLAGRQIQQRIEYPRSSAADCFFLGHIPAVRSSQNTGSHGRGKIRYQRALMARASSRSDSRSLMLARLSCACLPLARPISSLALPFFQ